MEDEALASARADKLLAQEEVWIRKGVEAHRTRSVARIQRLEVLRSQREKRRDSLGQVRLEMDTGVASGKIVAELKDVTMRFVSDSGDKLIVKDFSATILRGDKVGLIGPNGAGNTTLLKLILGALQPTSGKVRQGSKLEVAYFDQTLSSCQPVLPRWPGGESAKKGLHGGSKLGVAGIDMALAIGGHQRKRHHRPMQLRKAPQLLDDLVMAGQAGLVCDAGGVQQFAKSGVGMAQHPVAHGAGDFFGNAAGQACRHQRGEAVGQRSSKQRVGIGFFDGPFQAVKQAGVEARIAQPQVDLRHTAQPGEHDGLGAQLVADHLHRLPGQPRPQVRAGPQVRS